MNTPNVRGKYYERVVELINQGNSPIDISEVIGDELSGEEKEIAISSIGLNLLMSHGSQLRILKGVIFLNELDNKIPKEPTSLENILDKDDEVYLMTTSSIVYDRPTRLDRSPKSINFTCLNIRDPLTLNHNLMERVGKMDVLTNTGMKLLKDNLYKKINWMLDNNSKLSGSALVRVTYTNFKVLVVEVRDPKGILLFDFTIG